MLGIKRKPLLVVWWPRRGFLLIPVPMHNRVTGFSKIAVSTTRILDARPPFRDPSLQNKAEASGEWAISAGNDA